jgi:hypothetical protein
MNHSIYNELYKISSPKLKGYRTDLTKIDKEWIEKNKGVPFIHYTRENGTHILELFPVEHFPAPGEYVKFLFNMVDRRTLLDRTCEMAAYVELYDKREGYNFTVCYYDGCSLKVIDHKKAIEIVRIYKNSILKEWNKYNYEAA